MKQILNDYYVLKALLGVGSHEQDYVSMLRSAQSIVGENTLTNDKYNNNYVCGLGAAQAEKRVAGCVQRGGGQGRFSIL